MAAHNYKVRILLFQIKYGWMAQCLEHDIATQGKRIQDAIDALECIIHGIEPLSDIAPAPKSFFKMFEQAHLLQNIRTFHPLQKTLHQPIQATMAIAA